MKTVIGESSKTYATIAARAGANKASIIEYVQDEYWPPLEKLAFLSSNFNYTDRKWLDRSGKRYDADLVYSGCLTVTNDITITIPAHAGATIAKVNEAADTTGVTLNGAGTVISIDRSALPSANLWSIELSTGDLFVLQTMASNMVFAAAHTGVISGTQGVDWSWGTDEAAYPYHLKNGFSKYPYISSAATISQASIIYLNSTEPYEILWEGNLMNASAQWVFFNITLTDLNKSYALKNTPDWSGLDFTTRTTGVSPRWAHGGINTFQTHTKLKLAYNGKGYNVAANYTLSINDGTPQQGTNGVLASYDRAGFNWIGNSGTTITGYVKNHYISICGTKYQFIKDGVVFPLLFTNRPTQYIYVPAFSGVDVYGIAPTNPAYTDRHNGAETLVRMKATALIAANDVNNILYTNPTTPKAVDVTKFYPTFGNKIHINNGTLNQWYDLCVTTEALELYEYLNGYRPYVPQVSIRTDRHGNYLGRVMQDNKAKADTHVTRLMNFGTDTYEGVTYYNTEIYRALISDGSLTANLHDMPPAFWMYKDEAEGLVAYNAATADERATEAVIADQGLIGSKSSTHDDSGTSRYFIESIHSVMGIPYPVGVTPQNTDPNEMWWDWVIDAFNTCVKDTWGFTGLNLFTELGWLPWGINCYHPDVSEKLFATLERKNFFNRPDVEITDNLAAAVSIFSSAQSDSIISDGGVNCQKLAGYGGAAYGNFDLGAYTQYAHATYMRFEFDFKVTDGLIPCKRLWFGYWYPTWGQINQITGLSLNTWYKLIFQWYGNYYDYRVYTAAGECVAILRKTLLYQNQKTGKFRMDADGTDILIKNVRAFFTFDRNVVLYPYASVKWDDAALHTTETAAQWLELIKGNTVGLINSGNVPFLFGHYVQDTPERNADGTDAGVTVDRSYYGFNEWCKWCNAQGYKFVNAKDAYTNVTVRRSLMAADYLQYMSPDVAEAANSIDGTPVYKLAAGANAIRTVYFRSAGLKFVKFWSKGNFYIYIRGNKFEGSNLNAVNRFIDAAYTYHEIPIYIDADASIEYYEVTITASADSWFHKIAIDDL